MSNNKQSSVRWTITELEKFELGTSKFFSKAAIINHADRLHNEEHRKTYNQLMMSNFQTFEDYYNETFGGNK